MGEAEREGVAGLRAGLSEAHGPHVRAGRVPRGAPGNPGGAGLPRLFCRRCRCRRCCWQFCRCWRRGCCRGGGGGLRWCRLAPRRRRRRPRPGRPDRRPRPRRGCRRAAPSRGAVPSPRRQGRQARRPRRSRGDVRRGRRGRRLRRGRRRRQRRPSLGPAHAPAAAGPSAASPAAGRPRRHPGLGQRAAVDGLGRDAQLVAAPSCGSRGAQSCPVRRLEGLGAVGTRPRASVRRHQAQRRQRRG
mmetsp:Transcript_58516/g.167970  ORF Transcript_58516/g.167970 Transcript_58516/m.167970 type:complete len:244 (-) Transcript_58516:9-740(-)